MFSFLCSLLGMIVPTAWASTVDQMGQGLWGSAPGVDEMWSDIKDLFPFADAGTDGPGAILDKVNTWILSIIAFVAVALLVFAGIRMMAGGGNEEGFTEAKKIIKNVFIGLLCAMLADVVIMYVVQLVTQAAGGQ